MTANNSLACSTLGKVKLKHTLPRAVCTLLLFLIIFAPYTSYAKSRTILVSLASPYSQSYFPPELIEAVHNKLKQNKVIGKTFGEFRIAPPIHEPSGAPWHNVPLRTNPPYKYSPGNEVGTLLLTGSSSSGRINILFFVSDDKQREEGGHISPLDRKKEIGNKWFSYQ